MWGRGLGELGVERKVQGKKRAVQGRWSHSGHGRGWEQVSRGESQQAAWEGEGSEGRMKKGEKGGGRGARQQPPCEEEREGRRNEG